MDNSSNSRNTVDDRRKANLHLNIIGLVSLVTAFLSKSREHSSGIKRSGGFSNFESDFNAALREARSDERRDHQSLVVLVIASALALAIGSLQVSISFRLVEKDSCADLHMDRLITSQVQSSCSFGRDRLTS